MSKWNIIKERKKMTVAEINQYLIKINELQGRMSVPLFQKGNMALILRTVIWIVFFGK